MQVPASTTRMGRCLSWDIHRHGLVSAFIGDCCFHLGTCRVVQGVVVIELSCPSPVPCRWGPGGILHCCSWTKTFRSSQGTRKAPPARCSAGFWRWLLPLCGIARQARNLGGQPEGLTRLAKSPHTGHRQSHAALPGLSRERREQRWVHLSRAACPRLEGAWLVPTGDGPVPVPFLLAAAWSSRAVGRQPCGADGSSKERRVLSVPLPPPERGFGEGSFPSSWLGSTEQPLLGEILFLFPNADAMNGCSTMASVGEVARPASLSTSRSWRPHFGSVQEGRKWFAQAARIWAAVQVEPDSLCIVCWKAAVGSRAPLISVWQ